MRLCSEVGVPFVARGSGTGPSGGALPVSEGVVIVLSRLRGLGPVDADNARIVVESGVINLWVTRDAAPHDLAYDPIRVRETRPGRPAKCRTALGGLVKRCRDPR
ncbi:MAG: FAD-binding protein [Actinomycetota bacterium]|nr:FAD-binding protein [Actinomycetota bacterium]